MTARSMRKKSMSETIVVGGGAAGMLAAISCAQNGETVTIIEKNEKLGKKLFITGKGRCNLTNIDGRDEFFEKIVSNARFFYSAFSQLDNFALMDMIEATGTPLKTERGGRVFPKSDKSSDILKALEKLLKQYGVNVKLNVTVKEILIRDGSAVGVLTGKGEIAADRVIVCTGGRSYPPTGSTGDGYTFARAAGHHITELTPSLVPIECSDDWLKSVSGLTLKNVALECREKGKLCFAEQGEMLFTHFGISGPLVLTLSSVLGKVDFNQISISIDFKPALDEPTLDKRLLRDFEQLKNRQFKHAFEGLLPRSMIPVFVGRCCKQIEGLLPDMQVNSVTKLQRQEIGKLLKHFELTPVKYRSFHEAVITKGGIDVAEINPKTMESKKVKNLYFAGEVLDLDAQTGGYNLQIAFSTGYCAGGQHS